MLNNFLTKKSVRSWYDDFMNLENKKWLVACSGGPDSMALVKICLDKHLDFAIAHVNYHHRKEANEEEKYVTSFAKAHHIQCFVLNKPFAYTGNFEAQARIYRYNFFKEIVEQEHFDGVLVAHHKDDVLETYLMQKEKHLIPETYGLATKMQYEGILIYRPLLSYSKKDLEEICHKANIKYYIDCTNVDTSLSRNYMRHEVLAKMNDNQKQTILEEIQHNNNVLDQMRNKVRTYICEDKVSLSEYRNLEQDERMTLLHVFLKEYYRKDQGMSYGYKEELDAILMKQDDFVISFEEHEIVQDSGYFFVIKKAHTYAYQINASNDFVTCEYFTMSNQGKKSEGVTLTKEDYPLTIRNVQDGDMIQMRFGTKKVHRFFIDRHIPLYKRKTYPVVVNASGIVILVPGLGPDKNHYSIKPDFYVLQ